MSSTFSFDNWDMLLDPAASSSGFSSPPTETPSSATSGEFQPFVNVGLSLSGGGDRKTFALLYGGDAGRLCCGFIGSMSNSKFCIRAAPCGVAAHARKFEIDPVTFYLKENESRAFVNPSFKGDKLTEQDIRSLLTTKRTLKELTVYFEAHDSKTSTIPEDLEKTIENTEQDSSPGLIVQAAESAMEIIALNPSFDLESPRFLTDTAGIFSTPPQLSFDVDDEELNPFATLSASQPEDLVALLKEFHSRFVSLKTKWSQTFLEVDASHTLVVSDLKVLHDQTRSFKAQLLAVAELCKNTESAVLFKLQHLTDRVQFLEHSNVTHVDQLQQFKDDVQHCQDNVVSTSEDLSFQVQTVTSSLATLETKLGVADKLMKEFDKRFSIIFPILKDMKQSRFVSPQLVEIQQQLLDLTDKINAMDQAAWQQMNVNPSPVSVTNTPSLGAGDLQDLKHQIKVLQHRIVGGGIKIGSKVFQSFEEVQLWVKAELPIRRYGLFVDAVSILDFFSCLGHIDAENQVSTLHNANKAGFTSIYESRVATSVQNIFPKVFGKGDSHQYLPAIRHADKWDDGTDGLVYQITRGMTDVETQLSSAIDTVLDKYPEARAIASQCLFKAKRFVIDLCSFMSKDYFKWVARGHSKQEAWNMTSLCVRRVFEEIHSERVIARDIYDPNDLEFTTAKMLWATWKAHGVMEQYLRHHFYEHPSISAVLARHLADNHVKPDSSQIKALEKLITSMSTRIDKLEGKQQGKNPKGNSSS
jgi:hypothetical protein